ncbi:hypothetical protein [Janthinobacterium sp.]|uniref:hypothetical protein n=1 Tax=Janthinobacterium sp. TaxID=1871054 RepID=UPI0025872A01|nr:hypothetical protein [Janthinobacterium sp.]MCX7289725.1 hypothetical protein [Janthinobacterium sp.]
MKKTPIGHVACPVCDFPDAQVKEDKNSHAYIHCTDCNAQTFTRNDFRNGKLRGRMRAITVTISDDTVTVTAPVPATAPAADKAPPVKKPGGWFQPLLAQG